jgi:excisionase family DNA binding protein
VKGKSGQRTRLRSTSYDAARVESGKRHRGMAAKGRKGHQAERRHPKLKPQINTRLRADASACATGGLRRDKPARHADERRSDFNTKARSSDCAMGLRRDKENAPHLSKARSNDGALVLPPEERFFTKPELAKVMKVSVRCITDMMRRGEIRYLKINGHLVRFRLQDVNQRLSETVLFCEGPEGGSATGQRVENRTETRGRGDAGERKGNPES